MTAEHATLPDQDPRFSAVLLACIEAMDNGRPISREELLARYPEFAADLVKFLEDQERVDRCVAPLRAVAQAAQLAAPPTQAPDLTVGETNGERPPGNDTAFGDYELLGELGRGGMGVVYRARQKGLGRQVALKVVGPADEAGGPERQRFRNEAEMVAELDHRHIVPVYEVGEHAGQLYLSMKLLEGGSLVEHLGHFTADPRAAARLLAAVARAVHHAHQRGILHRDLKPGNILLDGEGRPHVSDFGLARRVEGDSGLTQSGAIVGTPSYMAPEQTTGRKGTVTIAADVYGLGAVLYALLTGQAPFRADTPLDTLLLVREREPEPPGRVNPQVGRDLQAICLKCLDKEPARRYGSAEALAEDLESWLNGEPIRARPISSLARAWQWYRRNRARALAGLAAVLLLMFVVAGLGWVLRDQAARQALAEEKVRDALAVLEPGLRLGNPHAPDVVRAARQVEAHLAGGLVGLELRQQAEQLLADLAMLARLEQIRLDMAAVKEGHFDYAGAVKAGMRAYREYGIDLEALGAPEAAARIRRRVIVAHLVADLEDRALAQRFVEKHGGLVWRRLLEVAQAADPVADEWRSALRKELLRGDRPETVRKQVQAAPTASLPAVTVALLARVMRSVDLGLAVKVLREGQRRHPADFWLNHELAEALTMVQPPKIDEAIGFYRATLALRPKSPGVHLNMGTALRNKGRLEEAIAAYREAIRLKQDYAEAHFNLGLALEPTGRLDEVISAYRQAIHHKKDLAEAHINLGNALKTKGRLDKAMACYREAMRARKDFAEAHCNLGLCFLQQHRYVAALHYLRRGHELGSKRPRWPFPSSLWVHWAEQGVIKNTLPRILAGKAQPADAEEAITLADMCQRFTKQYSAASGLYADAFAKQPKLADDLQGHTRYNGACAAALAGCGQGGDAAKVNDADRAGLRKQALDWLRADLDAWRKVLKQDPDKSRAAIAKTMQHWLSDPDFAGVRAGALVNLPEAEGRDWRRLWEEVEALRKSAAGPQK